MTSSGNLNRTRADRTRERDLYHKTVQYPHDWWGFKGNGGDLVVFRLVQFMSAVEIVYKRREIKRTVLLRSLSRIWEIGFYFLKAIVETD
jgi:hypothetical protein